MIDIIKLASMSAVENGKPCDLRFGTVISVNPLKVQISTDLIIPESLLVVPQNLTNHNMNVNLGMSSQPNYPNYWKDLNVTVSEESLILAVEEYSKVEVLDEKLVFYTDGSTNNGNSPSEPGDKVDDGTITIYNTLKIGDKVVLIRNQGGKVYYILDRV